MFLLFRKGEGVKKPENYEATNLMQRRTTHISCSPSCLHVDLPPLLQPLPPIQEVLEAAGVVGVGGRRLLCGLWRPAPLAVRPSVAVVEGLRAAALESSESWKGMQGQISQRYEIEVITDRQPEYISLFEEIPCRELKCIKEHVTATGCRACVLADPAVRDKGVTVDLMFNMRMGPIELRKR